MPDLWFYEHAEKKAEIIVSGLLCLLLLEK